MALQLKCGSYAHSPQPEVRIARAPLWDEDGLTRIGTSHTWTISGTLTGSSISDLKSKITALEAAYASPTVLQLVEGVTVREQILGSDGRTGLIVDGGVTYPEGNAAEYATKRRFDITVRCDIWDGGERGDPQILWLEETTSWTIDRNGRSSRSVSGRLRTKLGVSAYGKLGTVTPAVQFGYNRIGYRYDTNDDDDEMSYSFDDAQYWQAFPAGATDGQAQTRRSAGDNGVVRVSVSGSFTGAGAQAAADSAKLTEPQYRCVSEEQSTSPYDGSVAFSYEYIDGVNSDTDLISFEEVSEVEYSQQAFVLIEALDGLEPVRQDTTITPARARQNGSAVGASAWPAFPDPLYAAASITAKSRSKSGPTRGPNNTYHDYRISWSYDYAFVSDPTLMSPNIA